MENKLRKHINKRFRLYPKTTEILEVREELFSIMVDKYRDCLEAGKTEDQSFQEATDMMVDYKEAIAEVESGSSHSALRRMLVSVAAFTTFYFVALTSVYLFASMVVVRSFERTWLLAVAGAFHTRLMASAMCSPVRSWRMAGALRKGQCVQGSWS